MIKKESISIQKLKEGDVLSWADFIWHYWPEEFKKSFAKVGILVEDEKDVDALVNLSLSNGDLTGKLKDSKGRSIIFNFLSVLQSVPLNKDLISRRFYPNNKFELIKKY
jgi:hypothetical protein